MRSYCGIFTASASASRQIDRGERYQDKDVSMTGRIVVALAALTTCVWTSCLCMSGKALAQDVPGIEICTVEKTMERRTSCLQSNINFLQGSINKLNADHQQKLDAANRQIDALKATIVNLQKSVEDLQSAQKKLTDDLARKADASKDSVPTKPGGK
jgi:peptidoglycan hydrolase CwlO-like protein